MEQEGARSSEGADEQAELEYHVVARTEGLRVAACHGVVRCQYQDREIEAGSLAHKRFDEGESESSEIFVP
jgi:hypothetical protein